MLCDMPVKVYDNKYKLFFNRSTTITVVDIPDIPQHKFNFKSFTDFQNGDFIVDRLYAHNWSPEASISNTPSKRLSPDSVQDPEGPDILSPKLSATKAAKTKSGRNTKNK
ncbi:hypothetical protein RYX36_028056 [Vicia faba]